MTPVTETTITEVIIMRENLTELVFIHDRSGSMQALTEAHGNPKSTATTKREFLLTTKKRQIDIQIGNTIPEMYKRSYIFEFKEQALKY